MMMPKIRITCVFFNDIVYIKSCPYCLAFDFERHSKTVITRLCLQSTGQQHPMLHLRYTLTHPDKCLLTTCSQSGSLFLGQFVVVLFTRLATRQFLTHLHQFVRRHLTATYSFSCFLNLWTTALLSLTPF